VRGRASANTLSRRYGERPASVTTSTARCRRSSKSCLIAMRSNRLRPRSSVTSRSRSLSGRASPLALDPKTRTDWAPCDRETRKISKTGSRSVVTPKGYDSTLWPATYRPLRRRSSRHNPGWRRTSRRARLAPQLVGFSRSVMRTRLRWRWSRSIGRAIGSDGVRSTRPRARMRDATRRAVSRGSRHPGRAGTRVLDRTIRQNAKSPTLIRWHTKRSRSRPPVCIRRN
jgi:hypothetical protein